MPIVSVTPLVERLWARLEAWRAVAIRYEETAASYLGLLI